MVGIHSQDRLPLSAVPMSKPIAEPMFTILIDRAGALVKPMTLARSGMDAATVGCALLAANGQIYEGVCIHLACGLGFCAEAAAIASMIKGGETKIDSIVAVSASSILSPCGRCREMMIQVASSNRETNVILSASRSVKLKSLLPEHWLSAPFS